MSILGDGLNHVAIFLGDDVLHHLTDRLSCKEPYSQWLLKNALARGIGMLRKVKLYGELADFVGHKQFEIQADSLAKAVSFLINNFPQIEQYMNPRYYQVKIGNYAVNEKEIHHPIGQEDIHIVPVIAGAGRGVGKILLGAALIGISFLSFGTSAGMGVGFAKGFAKVGMFQKDFSQ